MPDSWLYETVKLEQEDRIRKAERARLYTAVKKANRQPSVFKTLLLALLGR